MSRQQSHATAGVWAFVRRRATAAIDARTSIELVGNSTLPGEDAAMLADLQSTQLGGFEHPVAAVRAWVATPEHRAQLTDEITTALDRALLVAEAHWREVDLLAGQIAVDANDSGAVDPTRLAQLDGMTAVLTNFSLAVRELVDDAQLDAPAVQHRLERALDAADAGGQLPGFVAAL